MAKLNVHAKLTGLKPTLDELKKFPPNVQKRWIKKAVTKGSQIINKAAKVLIPSQSRQYRKALGYRVWTGKRSRIMAFIGARLGHKTSYKGKPRDPKFYAHLVEGGRRALKPKSKSVLVGIPANAKDKRPRQWYGRHVAAVAPKRPLARAFKSSKSTVEATMIGILKQGIVAEAAKAAAKSRGK